MDFAEANTDGNTVELKVFEISLNRPTTCGAVARTEDACGPTLTAKVSRSGDNHYRHARLSCASPEEGDDPAHDCPTKEEIDEEDRRRIALVMAKYGGHEIHYRGQDEKQHGDTSFRCGKPQHLSRFTYR